MKRVFIGSASIVAILGIGKLKLRMELLARLMLGFFAMNSSFLDPRIGMLSR